METILEIERSFCYFNTQANNYLQYVNQGDRLLYKRSEALFYIVSINILIKLHNYET